MKSWIAGVAAGALLLPGATFAQNEIVIGGGSASGEYTNTIVPAIDRALRPYGFRASVKTSAGSQQNVEDVLSGQMKAALSQLDVAAVAMANDESESLVLLGKIAPEALLCAARQSGRVRNYHDLTDEHDRPLKVSVGKEKSGTARTFAYLQHLEPGLQKLQLVHKKNTKVELSRLISGNRDLVCFVMMPNPDNELIKLVADSDELFFIEFFNPKFLGARVGETRIYGFMDVPVSPGVWGFNAKKVKTLVTWVGVVVNEEAIEEGALDALATVVLKPDLLPPSSPAGKAQQLFDEFTKKAGLSQ